MQKLIYFCVLKFINALFFQLLANILAFPVECLDESGFACIKAFWCSVNNQPEKLFFSNEDISSEVRKLEDIFFIEKFC